MLRDSIIMPDVSTLRKQDVIYIPVNEGHHGMLIIIEDRVFQVYDLLQTGEKVKMIILNAIRIHLCRMGMPLGIGTSVIAPKQQDGYSCGTIVCMMEDRGFCKVFFLDE